MGRESRERRERIQAGLENPRARTVVAKASHVAVVHQLKSGSVDDQTGRLDELREQGTLSQSNLRDAIVSNAPGEMDKAIRKYLKKGKPVTVDTLCEEVKNNQSFLKMCTGVGLDLSWFENLARERMEAYGL